ncbi:RNA polymerase sigma-70 factor (ECF subfamily) [Crossiella equi]|uniref:RNA polymerase sigma-70 factor (ECF subfamily) n=1 Tax=Crossiella equi TaxID=130796 RepID=A0ABS5AHZ8_9PSEU|nr:sigma-70 family RNA polymerase sigma factor [Crossiella equi]MBP2475907.1 RNA polymerase sigma-70 factor (ECF subfamily) [Crossiella equi]
MREKRHGPGGDTAVDWQECLRLRPALLGLAQRGCPPGCEPEDVVHEALTQAAELGRVAPERLQAFLVLVVRRLCAEERTRARQDAVLFDHPRLRPGTPEDPTERVHDRMEGKYFRRRLRDFSTRDRNLLLLFADGLPHTEIAKELRTTVGATQSALHRIRERLR